MKNIIIASVLSLVSFGAFANTEIIFECKTTNNKIVSVQKNKNTVFYKFGKSLKSPELSFSIPKHLASTFQWNGVGSSIYYDVDVPNGNTIYTVYSSIDRMSSSHDSQSGIIVSDSKGKQLANILCNQNNKPYTNNIEGIDLPNKN